MHSCTIGQGEGAGLQLGSSKGEVRVSVRVRPRLQGLSLRLLCGQAAGQRRLALLRLRHEQSGRKCHRKVFADLPKLWVVPATTLPSFGGQTIFLHPDGGKC